MSTVQAFDGRPAIAESRGQANKPEATLGLENDLFSDQSTLTDSERMLDDFWDIIGGCADDQDDLLDALAELTAQDEQLPLLAAAPSLSDATERRAPAQEIEVLNQGHGSFSCNNAELQAQDDGVAPDVAPPQPPRSPMPPAGPIRVLSRSSANASSGRPAKARRMERASSSAADESGPATQLCEASWCGSSSASGASAHSKASGVAGTVLRKKLNAEACRKHRAKRKREAEDIRERNDQLEAERGHLMSRIATLQTMAEAMQGAEVRDLSKENALLRAEIAKHKEYVQDIIKVARAMPDGLPEEQLRIVCTAADAACSQMVGLGYASARGTSWVALNPLPAFGTSARPCAGRFQYLPHGVPESEARRLNLRIDVEVPFAAPVVSRSVWALHTEAGPLHAMYKRWSDVDGLERRATPFDPPVTEQGVLAFPEHNEAGAWPSRRQAVKCLRYVEREKNWQQGSATRDAVFVASTTAVDLSKETFALSASERAPATPEPCQAFVACTASAHSALGEPQVNLPGPQGGAAQAGSDCAFPGTYLSGHVVQSLGPARSLVSLIATVPLREEEVAFCGLFKTPGGVPISRSGKLDPRVEKSLASMWGLLAERCAAAASEPALRESGQ